jgi:hypothetical protein
MNRLKDKNGGDIPEETDTPSNPDTPTQPEQKKTKKPYVLTEARKQALERMREGRKKALEFYKEHKDADPEIKDKLKIGRPLKPDAKRKPKTSLYKSIAGEQRLGSTDVRQCEPQATPEALRPPSPPPYVPVESAPAPVEAPSALPESQVKPKKQRVIIEEESSSEEEEVIVKRKKSSRVELERLRSEVEELKRVNVRQPTDVDRFTMMLLGRR